MVDVFNSHDEFYRCPAGAINYAESVHFKIVLDRSLKCSAAKLSVMDDVTKQARQFEMFWYKDFGNGLEAWECDFKPGKVGLFWYKFELETCFGKKKIIKSDFGKGQLANCDDADISWQLTIYDKNFATPEWLNRGIMYQIFPDRFFNSGEKKESVPKDRILKREWGADFLSESPKDINNCYYGGDLTGITQKLPYLKSLGVTCIYLNPIFEAHSNHRYNTADYMKVDPMLGTEDDFKNLCQEAAVVGIKILLDGVFSHTGSDSIYFNKNGRYETQGAYNTKTSEYFNWYKFLEWPQKYVSWWNFDTLPEVDEENCAFADFITGENGVLAKWLKCGASGWRLDVADELPDEFIEKIRARVKKENPSALLLGEVWEDASNKESYGHRRKYLLGHELDSVMNYPFREAIIDFIKTKNSKNIYNTVLSIVENYPNAVLHNLMNLLSTHDTERIFTVIADAAQVGTTDLLDFVELAVAIQYTLPGVPSIFYGDEAGLTGGKDPFCRKCYPWDRENKKLLEFYKKIGSFRKSCSCLRGGAFVPIFADEKTFAFKRLAENGVLVCNFSFSGNNFFPEASDKKMRIGEGTGGSNGKMVSHPKNGGNLGCARQRTNENVANAETVKGPNVLKSGGVVNDDSIEKILNKSSASCFVPALNESTSVPYKLVNSLSGRYFSLHYFEKNSLQ